MTIATLPGVAAGIQCGGFDGACVACDRPTDTGLAFRDNAGWTAACLMALGVPKDLAVAMALDYYARALGREPGPGDHITMLVRVCADCASGPGFPVAPLCKGAEITMLVQVCADCASGFAFPDAPGLRYQACTDEECELPYCPARHRAGQRRSP